MTKDLSQRLITATLGIPLLLVIFYFGGVALLITLGILSSLGMWEYKKIITNDGMINQVFDICIVLCIYLFVAIPIYLPFNNQSYLILILTVLAARLLTGFIFNIGKAYFRDYLLTIMGWLYTGVLTGLIYRLGIDTRQQHVLLLLLVLIWLTDSSAYFIGMRFGTHRGIFPVSPRKSAEGYLAGLIAPVLLVILISFITDLWSYNLLLLTAISAGLFGQIGDLLESKIKRTGGVKDSSNIIPGHGGVLDRFDSLLIAAPALYTMIKLFT